MDKKPRLIAFYLPQYHPIPENDEWWGKGFTEWTNVAKAKPLFKGHYQPHLPADLGFYDLRVPEVREQQAELAREAGIEGFCYWHYWFAGKQLLERPFNEVLASGKPDFPFCLAWANESWKGIWHGADGRTLIEQTYPGEKDHREHFHALLPAFLDSRYIRVEGKPLFLIYRPYELPQPENTLDLWNQMAVESGLPGLHIVGVLNNNIVTEEMNAAGFDGFTISRLYWPYVEHHNILWKLIIGRIGKKRIMKFYQKHLKRPFHVYDYMDVAHTTVHFEKLAYEYYPCVIPNWDNTPRSGYLGFVGHESTPELFANQIQKAIERVAGYADDRQIIFIKSWNEWAEGNHLEPDQRYGHAYLQVVRQSLHNFEEFGL
jgi:lipopolysaccharide biosynthesis protein